MNKQARYQFFLDHFINKKEIPLTELVYQTPFQLLIAVILSAQCTDKRVNIVTPPLFKKFPTPLILAKSSFEEVFPYIKSISYPHNKTKYLIGTAKMVVGQFNNSLPHDVQELQKLPGVGRKTAHVVGAILYHTPTLGVDTHVFRVARRLGLAPQKATTPLAVEKELVEYIPKKDIIYVNQWMVLHGRYTCIARQPKCNICPLTPCCNYYHSRHHS